MRVVVALVIGLAATAPLPVVPHGQFLVSDRSGQLLVVDGAGRMQRRLPFARKGCCQVELAADRRHAFVSVYRSLPSLLGVELATGRTMRIAAGGSPALSPDGRALAYFTLTIANTDVLDRTGVAIRDLETGRTHTIPFTERAAWGTPPEVLINWSPDGRTLAVVGWNRHAGSELYLVDVAHARTIESQPSLGHLLAPVFLDDQTVLGLANCCTGTHQRMVAVSLATGTRVPFATLPEPPESLRRVAPGTFAVTTPDGFLLRFSRSRVTRLGRGRYFSVSG